MVLFDQMRPKLVNLDQTKSYPHGKIQWWGLPFKQIEDIVKFLVMIWDCMGWNEVNILSDIEGGMDDESLVIILGAGLLKSIKKSNILKMQLFYSIIITLSRSSKEHQNSRRHNLLG